MLKSGDQEPQGTKGQLVAAALETLRTEGFAGATSRAIARAGGFNQALIFYHFGSVDSLLLAALDASSEARLQPYREALEQAESISELLQLAARIYREDRAGGHTTVVAQMVAGSLARPELAARLVERMEPWIAFCEDAVAKLLPGSPAAELVPPRELAYALVTFYLGVNLVTHLDVDSSRADALFDRVGALAPVLEQLLGTQPSG
jgi:AcrR family transcriptional regulator